MDFSNIKVPGAELSFGILHHTNLQGADLSRVNFKKAFLAFANLTNANLTDIFIGQLSSLKSQGSIFDMALSKRNG